MQLVFFCSVRNGLVENIFNTRKLVFAAHPVNAPQDHKITLKRVMDFVKDKGDENVKEINRKLQHMLEETLTKNMHLQKVNTPVINAGF